MSGQWEVVGRKNDRRSKVPVPKGNNQPVPNKNNKANILNGVKIEEVLPKSQVQKLYSGKQSNKENKQPEKTKNVETKKIEKKANKPASDPPKPKPPKSIEAGLLSIDSEEFSSVYEHAKKAFPDAPIVWLKELTQFLNQKLPIEIQDSVFSNKAHGFPLYVTPAAIKLTIEKAVKEAGKSNAQAYFDIALTSMVTDLGKGLPAVGYRFFLQYIALNEPKLVISNLSKHIALRNSYQNRANVALSILWAVGHVGVNDLHCGLKVFEDLMLPLIEMKSYSRYVVKYLLDLVSRTYEAALTKEEYLLILDVVHSNKKNFPSELQQDLLGNLPKLKELLFKNSKQKYNDYLEPFLKKIATNSNSSYQNCLCDIIVQILNKDQSVLATWNKLYAKNLISSAILIRYISNNYDNIKPSVMKSLKDLLLSFTTINEELSQKKRKDDGLKEAIWAVKKLQEQKTAPMKSGGFFKKLLGSLVYISFIVILAEPLCRLDKPRDDLYVFRLGRKVGDLGLWVDQKLDVNVPKPYYTQFKEHAQPYGALASDIGKILINVHDNARASCKLFVDEKYPIVVDSIENYAPGLIENTQTMFKDTFANTIYYYRTSVKYLQKEVFVGQLSPENIQRVVVGAYNTTSEKAIEYYHWVYEKVQTTIK